VPGFLASDIYLGELYFWLRRMGYHSYMSNIGRNANCFDLQVDKLQKTVEKAYLETGRKVHLIGHSLGGMLSRAAAAERPDRVASVITMGSPFGAFLPIHWCYGQVKPFARRSRLSSSGPTNPIATPDFVIAKASRRWKVELPDTT